MTTQPLQATAPLSASGAFRVVRDELDELRGEMTRLDAVVRAGATEAPAENRSGVSLVVFSADLDRLLAAMNLATGAACMGEEVNVFFTFWGTCALRKPGVRRRRPLIERLFGWMLPTGHRRLKLSTMNMGGLGTAMLKQRMKDKQVESLDSLFEMARESGVTMWVCDMSMDLLGIAFDDLIEYPGLSPCGAVGFLSQAMDSRVTLFI